MKINKEEDIKRAVIALLTEEPETTWTLQNITKALKLRGKQLDRLATLLRGMVRSGEIVKIRKGSAFALGEQADLVTAKLRVVRNGAGNVTERSTGRVIWIESSDLGTALSGDLVTVRLNKRSGGEKGRVIRIEERSPRFIVGTLIKTGKFLCVVPLNPIYRKNFYVPSAEGAKPGDRVVLRFTGWESPQAAPEGEITTVIGPADQPSLDTEAIMQEFGFSETFSAKVLKEAEEVSALLDVPGEREDLRQQLAVTIDPVQARDFDDALSLTKDTQGNRILMVHIADVTHYVRENSAIDREAQQRCTSVYLVDKVIPMLPEQLSNGVCSLQPGQERLCFTVFMTFDVKGRMVARRFAKTRVVSRTRLSYEQALDVITGNKDKLNNKLNPEIKTMLNKLWELAAQLRQQRFERYALDLDVPEVEIEIDKNGRMTGMRSRPYDRSHQLIEECMVAANEAVATELWTRGIKIPARLHESPDEERLEELRSELAILGIQTGNLSEPQALAELLRSTQDNPLQYHVHVMVLRSMKRALYSGEKIGHFGLAKKYYAHFTAPIRRYPDLVLHRQLTAFISDKGGKLSPKYLANISELATEREQEADDAVRQLIEIKKFRFLLQQLEERKQVVYEAVIVRCTNYGVFVELPELAVSGMIHISNLSKQFVRYNDVTETLSAGKVNYKIGMVLQVVVAAVDFDQRRIDFVPVDS